jgi:hypothetical protein
MQAADHVTGPILLPQGADGTSGNVSNAGGVHGPRCQSERGISAGAEAGDSDRGTADEPQGTRQFDSDMICVLCPHEARETCETRQSTGLTAALHAFLAFSPGRERSRERRRGRRGRRLWEIVWRARGRTEDSTMALAAGDGR